MIDIGDLVAKMTLEEKISLLAGVDLWQTAGVPRLGIPPIKVTDGPNGARGAWGDMGPTSSLFPVGTALAATWNTTLVQEVGAALAHETRAKGAHVLLGPTVNIHRTPLAGRNFECFSEDPCLSGKMAASYIRGLQGAGVAACIKHFVCNDQEFERMSISAQVDDLTLREIYLEPFRVAMREAKPWALMSSYNKVNGIYASENAALLKRILKEEWGFDGAVISDWKGTYSENVPAGGLDLEMPGPARWMSAGYVRKALESGALASAELDDMVRRILRLIERTGGFAHPEPREERAEDTPERRALIRRVAQETIVLLKNERGLLPLDPTRIRKIAVIGELAARPNVMGGGSSRVSPHYVVSSLEGIRSRAGNDVEVSYALGCPVHRSLPVLDRRCVRTENGKAQGLHLYLYDNLDFSGSPAYESVTDRFDIDWWGPGVPNVDQARFCLRLTGTFTAASTGIHTFSLDGIGQSRLFLDEGLLIDHWDPADFGVEKTAEKPLSTGQKVKIQVDYRWNGISEWRTLRVGYLPPQPQDPIAEAVALARQADAVIIVAGLTSEWESEGFDRANMALPGQQEQLIQSVAEANSKTIVVVNAGSPVTMPWIDRVAAVLDQWYNGQECGNALADVLFGDLNPSGRLPTTFPVRYEDNPTFGEYPGREGQTSYREGVFVGYRHYDARAIKPLFPFGYGLSYTAFEMGNLRLSRQEITDENGLDVSLDVKNTGRRVGKQVVQLYVRDMVGTQTRPEQELKAFAKIELAPGQTKSVQFHLDQEAFWCFSPTLKQWIVEPGEFEIRVGSSSRDLPLRTRIAVSKAAALTATHAPRE